ncbi:hypothetical protein AALO_G00032160 [Alosa alosa]|uniref:Uncharacterized protein n=1 Tax=Alosa alosa TaxID=278164 RepID=A0AAV6HGE7_9TELE|nr:hypothetical protein AALO_G00032160 [Alosa alosa]
MRDRSYARTPAVSRASPLPADLQQIRGSKTTSGKGTRDEEQAYSKMPISESI